MQPVSNSVPGVGIEEGMAANEYMEDELSSPWKLCTTSAAQRLIRLTPFNVIPRILHRKSPDYPIRRSSLSPREVTHEITFSPSMNLSGT